MSLTVPYQYGSARLTIEQLQGKTTFSRLDPEFQRRLISMFTAAGGAVGLGTGWRDPVANDREVARRQALRAAGGHPAPMQPSDRTWHCATPAQGADLVGNLGWVAANCAAFGLRTFSAVNGEPWHVACVETPTRRNPGQQFRAPQRDLGANQVVGAPVVEPQPAGFPPFNPAACQFSLWPLAPNKPTVRLGFHGDAAAYAQGVMRCKGGENHQIPVDGIWGRTSAWHWMAFQNFFGLHADGWLGPESWALIDRLASQ